MYISNKLRKRISAVLAAVMFAGIPAFQSIPAEASNVTSLIGIAGIGMKINSYTRYNYVLPKDLTAGILCMATNGDAQHPTNGGMGTYACHVVKVGRDSKYMFPAGYTTAKINFNGNAGSTQTVTVALAYNKVTGYSDGKPTTERGTIPITVRVKLSGGSNTVISGDNPPGGVTPTPSTFDSGGQKWPADDGEIDINVDPIDGIGGDDNPPNGGANDSPKEEGYNDGNGLCLDGSYFCPEESAPDSKDPDWWGKPGEEGVPGEGTPDNGVPPDGGSIPDDTDVPPDGGSIPDDTDVPNKKPDYGDVINDMIGDKNGNSYNSPNIDWGSSNGRGNSGDNGVDDLDDYFNGIGDGSGPDGMTMDEIPLDYSNEEGEPSDYEQQSSSEAEPANGYGEANGYNGGESRGGTNESDHLGDFDAIPEAYQEALNNLDGLNDDGNGLLGDIDESSESLKDRLNKLLAGKDSSLSNSSKRAASDQDLSDIAKDILLANGYTAADIAAGKNYDSGSAYTEPLSSWDMNRITTLLKGRKISLTSPSNVKNEGVSANGRSALSRVSKASLDSVNYPHR